MAISTLVDLVAIYVNSGGSGNLLLGEPVPGFRGASALTDGLTYSYSIQQTSEWEYGTFTYLGDTQSIARAPQGSSNGGAPIYVRAGTQLTVTALSADLGGGGTIPLADTLGTSTTVAPTQRVVTEAIDGLQDSLDAKYDASNPSAFVDAAGALAAAVGTGGTQAPTNDSLAGSGAGKGANLIGFKNAAVSGATGVPAQAKLAEQTVTPEDISATAGSGSDDYAALAQWASNAGSGVILSLNAKEYKTSQPIVLPAVNYGRIEGRDKYLSRLVYTGATTTSDILTLGDMSRETLGWRLANFTIDADTHMTAGHALHCKRIIFTQIDDVVTAGQYGGGGTAGSENLFDNIYIEGFLYVRLTGLDCSGRGTGLKIAGPDNYGAGLFLSGGGKIGGMGQHGIWCGGGCGGVMLDETDVISNSQSGSTYANVKIDNALYAVANREIWLNDRLTVDGGGGYGVHVNDTLIGASAVGPGTLRFAGAWICSALGGANIYIQSWGQSAKPSLISIVGCKIYNGSSHGIQCVTSTPRILAVGNEFSYNQGYGIVAGSNLKARANNYWNNTLGDYSGALINDNLFDQTQSYGDSLFYNQLASGNPTINFDTNDFIRYFRSTDLMDFYAAGARQLELSNQGALMSAGRFGDINFGAYLTSGNPTLNMDTNDFISYDRGANQFNFYIGGTRVFHINASGGTNG